MPALVGGKILVPIDFTDESFAAVDVAIDLAGGASKVTVLHVLPEQDQFDYDLLIQAIDHAKHRNQTESALRQRFDDSQHRELNVEVTFGDPGRRITEVAEVRHADMIVMPSHGRTGLKRLYLGSVAERVVRLAHCPVLVLRNGQANGPEAAG